MKATKNLDWEGWLIAYYGPVPRDNPDLHFAGPRGCDRTLLYGRFCLKSWDGNGQLTEPSLVEELEARGYDITTLEFRIRKKMP